MKMLQPTSQPLQTGLVADRAVERMIDEQEFHLPAAGLLHFFVPHPDLHAVAHVGGASGLKLRHAFHFDEAHPALADDGQRRVIAEMRNVDVGCLRGFNDVDAVLDFDFSAVDGNFSHWGGMKLSRLRP